MPHPLATRLGPPVALAVLMALALGGSWPAAAQEATPAAAFPLTLPDCRGGSVTFDAPPERVVTLDAYAAEFVIALGLGDRVVGTGFPHPETQIPENLRDDFAAIPVLGSGLAGDARGLPSREAIAAARPDLVLSAYSVLFGEEDGQVKPGDITAGGAVPFASCWDAATEPVSDLEETYAFFEQLGRIFGVPERAAGLTAAMRARQAEVTARVGGADATPIFALATDPNDGQPLPTWGGAGLPNGIMALAGCRNVFGDVVDDAFFPSAEEVAARDPRVLMLVTDFAVSDGDELIAAVRANPVLSGTAAARDGRFVVVSHVLVGGPSPRNLEAVEAMAAACHPEAGV